MAEAYPSSHPFVPSRADVAVRERPEEGEALRESLLRALAASDAVGVAVCDRAFRYLLWNRFMEELTGLPAEEVLGRSALDIYPHLRDEGVEGVLNRVLAGETVSLPDRRYTVPGVRSGWIWVQYHPHRDLAGAVVGVVGIIHEVTERVRAEAAGRAGGTAAALRGALERGEVTAFYQPLVSLATGEVSGAEALARWRHPERGWLPPAAFVRAAEESGLIGALGGCILREACTAAAAWPRPLEVSVNLSVRQLAEPGLPEEVRGALEGVGLPGERLRLEVTESMVVEDPDAAAEALAALRELGVRVWMDDFGTGYSSLALLHRLPVDGVKVDRSFVAGMGHDRRAGQVVAAVLGLARGLGVETVAEGVERPEQLFTLRTLGCGAAQGYLFAPPLEPAAFAALAARAPRW